MKRSTTFFPNHTNNSLSEIIDEFLSRQVYLEATATVILNLESNANLEFGHSFSNIAGFNVLHNYVYTITPNDYEKQEHLRNYLYLNLVAQSVENFETYLKRLIKVLPDLNSLITLSSKLRSNQERIKFIKSNSALIQNQLNSSRYKEIYDLFLVVENVRHSVVHSQMRIDPQSKINVEQKEFKKYFSIKTIEEDAVIFISLASTQQVIIQISTLAYLFFEALSIESKLPIDV